MMAIPYLMPLLLSFFPFLCCNVFCAQLVQVNNFGNNPSGIQMFEYVPNNVKPNPPLLVANHWCTGSAQAMYFGSKFSKLADQYGFIVIYPSVTRSSKCWDVYSANGLRRNGGSDSQGIISMVNYEINTRKVDKSKVFVTGSSNGAMMTNVLLAEYPDVFAAGSAIAGVPYSCFATTGNNTWNSTCSSGNVNQSPSQWGNLVRAAFPGYNGKRPRVQLIHGSEDVTLNFKNLQEELDQWSNVLGLISQTPAQTDQPNVDISGVTAIRRRYGGTGNQPPLETITLQGATHSLSLGGILSDLAARFFGLIP